jgi:hypothetical protein
MHKDMLTRHASRNRDADLALTGAIHEETVRLRPCGDGFAQEGFPGVGDVEGAG